MVDHAAPPPVPVTAAATCCATFVDEWVRCGVRHAVVSPGSRSTPLALALAADGRLAVHVVHDERSAAFTALGVGLATGVPAVLLCTSGTAAAEHHAAVVEAHQAEVPLVVCTADRPPELRDVAAPQTIDQVHLFGRSVRWFADPGVPDDHGRAVWRSVAARAVAEATGPWPGPVHLNLPFRDPLVGVPGDLPPGRPGGAPWHRRVAGVAVPSAAALAELAAVLGEERGVVVAGAGAGRVDAVLALAEAAGWPVLADPRSGVRVPGTVAAADALLRDPSFAEAHRPSVVLQLGAPWASKVLAQWLAAAVRDGARRVVVTPSARWVDPEHDAADLVVADPTALCEALAEGRPPRSGGAGWRSSWLRAETAAQRAITAVLGGAAGPDAVPGGGAGPADPTEPWLARSLVAGLPEGTTLVVSSSMPVRDVEWYGAARHGLRVLANRGANGIDGVTSTAIGVALTGAPTVLLVGDVAFVHDASALVALADRAVDLCVVVVDNRGGGIFEFLPQAAQLPRDRFEQLFGTPHGTDLEALAVAHGLRVLPLPVALTEPGVRVAVVSTDRRHNVAVHDAVHAAVRAAVGGLAP